MSFPDWARVKRPMFMIGLLCFAGGCSQEPTFRLNNVYLYVQEAKFGEQGSYNAYKNELQSILVSLFGTPDEPKVPPLPDVDTAALLDLDELQVAAGPVRLDEQKRARGLYREHCAHCHGVSGDGAGPTASFLNPYPRDFRKGVFKFKSTPKGEKPTHADLHRTLMEGIPGTAMPSFRLLDQPDRDALINYVMYLSIRGEVERKLMEELGELDAGEKLIRTESPEDFAEDVAYIKEIAAGIVSRWIDAPSRVTEITRGPTQWDITTSRYESEEARLAAIEHGRRLFYGEIANCVKCHGESALGDGQTNDYDDWAKDFIPPNVTPAQVQELSDKYTALGALPPRNIRPRNLRRGVFRGGRRPIDIYWRVRNGIDGSPMPAALMKPDGAPPEAKGLTEEDLWALVTYVRNLEFEAVSRPPEHLVENERLRP
ncbi:MAG: cytochrome c [Pirellulaceae bacterium]